MQMFIAPFQKNLPNLKVCDWNELNSIYLQSQTHFNGDCEFEYHLTLTLMVQEKVKEIGILKPLALRKNI